jgi:hypothetical protein
MMGKTRQEEQMEDEKSEAGEQFRVLVNKYSHTGSSFARELYGGQTFSRVEAVRLADKRAALGVDRFVIVQNGQGSTVYCPTAR